ncbi:uncharacterized protein [Argopecten irradians]|uniref:uncharacterized protein n=1 Tax=Argopecten irradians TaxID=31199 RepID=UPI00371C3CDF
MDSRTGAAAQLPIRIKGQSYCSLHSDQNVSLVYRSCSELICVTTFHKGHDSYDFEEAATTKRGLLQRYLSQGVEEDLELVCVKCVTQNHKGHDFEDLEEAVRTKRSMIQKYLDREVEDNLNRLKIEIREFIARDTEQNKNNIEELVVSQTNLEVKQTICSDLEKNIEICKELLQSGSSVDIYDCDVQPYTSYPTLSQSEIIEEIEERGDSKADVTFPTGHVEKMYATIPKNSKGLSPNTINYQDERTDSQRKETDDRTKKSLTSPNVDVVDAFESPDTKFIICDIAAAPGNTAWVCCRNSKIVTLFDSKGTVMEEVEFDELVYSVSVSPTTGSLWAGSDHTVYEVSETRIRPRIRLDTILKCICVSSSENIILGMSNEVSVVKADGEIISSTKFHNIPNKISESPVTKNIAVLVVDKEGVCAASSIMIMDKHLTKLRFFTLKGNDKMAASCVSYDRKDNLIVEAVVCKDCIYYNVALLFDGNGRYQRTLVKTKRIDQCKHPVNSIGETGVYWRVYQDDSRSPQNIEILTY